MTRIAYVFALVWICLLPWESLFVIPGVGTIGKVFGILTLAVWVSSLVLRGSVRELGAFHLAAIAFAVWNVVSIIWSISPEVTLERHWDYCQNLFLVILVWDLFITQRRVSAGLQAYLIGMYVCLGVMLSGYFLGLDSTLPGTRMSVGTLSPNDAGLMLAIGIPFAGYLTVQKSPIPKLFLLRLLNFIYVPVALLGILLTGSRGSLIAAIPGILFVILFIGRLSSRSKTLVALAVIAASIAAVLIVPSDLWVRFGESGDQISEGDLTGRVYIWREGIEVFFRHWVIGVGGGGFSEAISSGRAAHNTALSVGVDLGIVGLFLFTLMVLICVRDTIRQPVLPACMWGAALAIWLLGISVHNWEQREPTWMLFALVAAAGSARDLIPLSFVSRQGGALDVPSHVRLTTR